jgi:thiamine biosynthesis lipoprotein
MTGRRTATASIMGTVMSVAAPADTDPELFAKATEKAFSRLRHADELFSPFKRDSPVSRIKDGRLPLTELDTHRCGAQIREVLAVCASLKAQSGGAFDAWAVGDPPVFDPCGAVKGWAAEKASAVLTSHGLSRHTLGAGGDVRVRGGSDEEPWRVGITDPHTPGRILAVAELTGGATATSGTAERGAHIWDPRNRRRASHLAQVTVIGPSLTWADGYATAAMALGAQAYGWLNALAGRTGYQALTIDHRTGVWWTPGMPGHLPSLRGHAVADERMNT